MNDPTVTPPNPYASGGTDKASTAGVTRRRPTSVVALGVVLALISLGLLGQTGFRLSGVLSAGVPVLIPWDYALVILQSIVAAMFGIVAAVGLLTGKRFGWWLAIAHCYIRLAAELAIPVLTPRPDTTVTAADLQGMIPRGAILVVLLLFLNTNDVVACFGIGQTTRLAGNGVVLALSMVLAAALNMWAMFAT